jgi:glycosyltransferase involved in cell wall biosynthesis
VTVARRPRLLLLAMYPLNEGRSGPIVRIRHMLAALRAHAEVEVLEGYRPRRRVAIARYLATGRLRRVQAVYVESSTALPCEMDLALLGSARAVGRPVLTYIRDAYQIFPDYYVANTLRRRASRLLFPAAISALKATSNHLAFPSMGLARAVLHGNGGAILLPPGAPPPISVPRDPAARSLLFVGDLRAPAQGGEALLRGVELARQRGAEVDLVCVTREGGAPAVRPSWLRLEQATSDEIPALLPGVIASVIPRSAGAYNDLAIPIKLMEYLSYGRPILTTDRLETARIVRGAGAGIIVDDGPEGLAAGIARLLEATAGQRAAWERGAHEAASARSWNETARMALRALGLLEDMGSLTSSAGARS